MTIVRINKNKNYTVLSNYHLKDKNLSLKAKGLLSLMLSLPENWDYTEKGLTTLSKDCLDSVKTTLKELENNGYLIRKQLKDEKGKFKNNIYDIFENPILENSITENPITENPLTEKPTQLNTNILNTKNNIYSRFVKPTLAEIQEYCIKRNNNVDAKKFFDYYEASDWEDAKGNKVKNWKQKVITWEGRTQKEEPKQQVRGEIYHRL